MARKHILAFLGVFALLSLVYHVKQSTKLVVEPQASSQSHVVIPEDGPSEYRKLLNTITPLDRAPHSKTLGVASRIYVIGLPGRGDRRKALTSLEKAMDITFTYHDSTDYRSPVISQILERIRYTRAESRIGHEAELRGPEAYPFSFPSAIESNEPLDPDDIAGSELWTLSPDSPLALPPLPPPPVPDTRPPNHVTMGEGAPEPQFPLKPVEIACWHSHFEVLRKIADGEDEVAIILEDDIDLEWDLERRLRYLWQFLPSDWDQVMLGHCQSNEAEKKAVQGTSYLHPATHTMCTHAYAVSKKSAARLVRTLRHPLFAYSRPIDHAFIYLNFQGRIKPYSVYPPVVVQSKTTLSDISAGIGPEEDFYLVDSALERVRLYES